MQEKFKTIIKKAEVYLKKFEEIVSKKHRAPDVDLIIPGENYLKLRGRYYSYKNLLLKNNELLNTLAEVEEGIETKTVTLQSFRSYLASIFNTAFNFVQSLNDMADNRYMYLYDVLERIKLEAESQISESPEEQLPDLVIPVNRITAEHSQNTGGKAGNFGEVRNIIKLPAPRGFSLTVRAYNEFISLNKLDEKIISLLAPLDLGDTAGIDRTAKEIKELISGSVVPSIIEERILAEIDRIGKDKGFSVRSSAVGEDGKVSFAGQFKSVLNVKRDSVIEAYKEVIASKYDSRAIFYRMAKGIKDRDIPMAVFVLEMVDARSSGVLYTLNPGQPEKEEAIMSSVWGQGQYAVNGAISPDMYILDRNNNGKIISKTISDKKVKLALNPSGGVEEISVPEDERNISSISDDEIKLLYNAACLIENHFGTPQDIEWSIDELGRIQILQTRSLHIRRVVQILSPGSAQYEKRAVLSEGEIASRGIASGPVFIIDRFDQIQDIPEGAVLVAKSTSSEFVKIMPTVSAIIFETGSRTSHLATVAREFNVPAVINAGNIRNKLRNKDVVTVDANTGRIYKGHIQGILYEEQKEQETATDEGSVDDEKTIRGVMKNITPLHLITIDETSIEPKDFRTIHDIIRFVHEASVKEMFRIGELTEGEDSTQQLASDHVPMVFYIIDLDGGLAEEAKFLRKINPKHIKSVPFNALWRGMTYEGVKWSGAVDIDMGGLASVMARSFVRTGVAEKGGKAYVIVTDQYLNLSVKLAYHFTVFDAFCGESYINNYINFRFQGGGASAEGRGRRALFIKEVLESMDFRVEVKGDMVVADIKGASRQETEDKLDILGRLLGCSRQLDMAISSMEAKDWYVKAFLEGNYSFHRE